VLAHPATQTAIAVNSDAPRARFEKSISMSILLMMSHLYVLTLRALGRAVCSLADPRRQFPCPRQRCERIRSLALRASAHRLGKSIHA
jgi:hypothetical protein